MSSAAEFSPFESGRRGIGTHQARYADRIEGYRAASIQRRIRGDVSRPDDMPEDGASRSVQQELP